MPPERVKEVVASSNYVEINVQDAYPFDEDADDKKSTLNLECDSNSSFDMESISLDTGCNQVRYSSKMCICAERLENTDSHSV